MYSNINNGSQTWLPYCLESFKDPHMGIRDHSNVNLGTARCHRLASCETTNLCVNSPDGNINYIWGEWKSEQNLTKTRNGGSRKWVKGLGRLAFTLDAWNHN